MLAMLVLKVAVSLQTDQAHTSLTCLKAESDTTRPIFQMGFVSWLTTTREALFRRTLVVGTTSEGLTGLGGEYSFPDAAR